MTLEQLKRRYDKQIAEIERSIEFFRRHDPEGKSKIVPFYEGRLWVFRRFRKELEDLDI